MKKPLYLLVLCLCISNFINAQYYSKSYVGLKGGANYSKFMPNELMKRFDDIGYVGKFGAYFGAFVNIELTDYVKIQPELIFALQGSSFKSENIQFSDPEGFLITRGDYRTNINEFVISVPIMGQYFFSDLFYIEGGPQFAYSIDTSEKVKETPIPAEFNNNNNNSPFDDLDKFDFGASIGLGYKVSDTFTLNGRYFFSLISRNETIKSSIFNLGIEYQL
ncbi:porin family protein [Algibacter sp. 2305UL17-15]|uniref:porin family protein n=1 Tax=Algibacter sp. 2305UL17-15 TaxID=3231268 RepID=UPI003459FBF3